MCIETFNISFESTQNKQYHNIKITATEKKTNRLLRLQICYYFCGFTSSPTDIVSEVVGAWN